METQEWLKRCAARYAARGGLEQREAEQAALACQEGIDPVDHEGFRDDPEGAADEDMSYWTDDGE